MADPPPELSFTPPGTPLSASPQYHNSHSHSSMEDPQTEGARTPKRQRVDSGSGVHENLSIEAASTTAAAAAAVPANSNSNSNHPDHTPNRPAKVTINMKSPTSTSEIDPLDSSPTLHPHSAPTHSPPPPSPSPTPNSIANANSNPNSNVISISVSSSPAASPHIEIADLEDMEQDSNTSNWRPLQEVVRDDPHPDLIEVSDMAALVDSFPRVGSDMSLLGSLQTSCQILEKCKANDGKALT